MKIFGWITSLFSGAGAYAYLAVGAVVLALGAAVGGLWLLHKADVAELESSRKDAVAEKALNAQFREDLAEAEADKAVLAQRTRDLDSIVTAQKQRLNDKEAEKKAINDAFEKLAASAPKATQDCLRSPLPASVTEWLRDDGNVGENKDGPRKSP